jgi:hypothetical protein
LIGLGRFKPALDIPQGQPGGAGRQRAFLEKGPARDVKRLGHNGVSGVMITTAQDKDKEFSYPVCRAF